MNPADGQPVILTVLPLIKDELRRELAQQCIALDSEKNLTNV